MHPISLQKCLIILCFRCVISIRYIGIMDWTWLSLNFIFYVWKILHSSSTFYLLDLELFVDFFFDNYFCSSSKSSLFYYSTVTNGVLNVMNLSKTIKIIWNNNAITKDPGIWFYFMIELILFYPLTMPVKKKSM